MSIVGSYVIARSMLPIVDKDATARAEYRATQPTRKQRRAARKAHRNAQKNTGPNR